MEEKYSLSGIVIVTGLTLIIVLCSVVILIRIQNLDMKITNLQNQEVRIFPSDEDCAVRLMYFKDGDDQLSEPEKMLCCWHISEKQNLKEK